jgi:hypothetical protein
MIAPEMKKENKPVYRHNKQEYQHYCKNPPDQPGYFIKEAHEYYFSCC